MASGKRTKRSTPEAKSSPVREAKSPKRTSRRVERFAPFAYERTGLDLRVERAETHEGAATNVIAPDEDASLVIPESEWSRLTVRFVLAPIYDVTQRVLPKGERQRPPLRAVIALRCGATRWRRAFEFDVRAATANEPASTASFGREERECCVEIERADVHDRLECRAHLLRAHTGAPAPGFGTLGGLRVASSARWTIYLEGPRAEAGKFLEIRYAPFGGHPTLRAYANSVFHLEAERDDPVLWLNRDHAQLVPILDHRGRRGRVARLREVLYDLISQAVWTELFVRIVARMERGEPPLYAWERPALDELLVLLERGRTPADRRASFRERLAYGGLAMLLPELSGALQKRDDLAAHMLAAVREIGGS